MFGSVQKVDLTALDLKRSTHRVYANTAVQRKPDRHLLSTLQHKITHVVYILRENKTYDTYLGDDAILNARGANGGGGEYARYAADVPNTRKLAEQFAVGDNVYADAEESNAGHSFALAATSTDFQQKTQLERGARPLTNIKNQDPEDYPLRGYLFNAMARGKRSFRDYGDSIRISGYDEGSFSDYCADDPKLGCSNTTYNNIQDTTSPTVGLGGLYSETLPALKVLGGHLDEHYPGWNLRISDQRRAREFITDFQALIDQGRAPQFTYVWLPGDHTGGCSTGTVSCRPDQEVIDNDKALGQILDYLTHSAIWPRTAVFLAEDDGQSSPDHVSPHRTYSMVISPYVKHETVIHRLSSTVSIPKTIEEILNLPAMGYGDLLANDLLDWFTTKPDYTPFTPVSDSAYPAEKPVPAVAQRIWDLTAELTDEGYDNATAQLGVLDRLYNESRRLAEHPQAVKDYERRQEALYAQARRVAASGG
nr:alkaline phosphatase family protein [Microlunatus panaciterrae]